LLSHRDARGRSVGQTSLSVLEGVFSGSRKFSQDFHQALRYDKKKNGYPCPIQLGAINEPFDNIERQQGWFFGFADLVYKYKQPVRVSTKAKLLQRPDYLKKIGEHPELWWFAFSIITPDDEILEKVDWRAPNASERFKSMKCLSDIGVKTSLRFRPILPGISDRTKKFPKAYKVLIQKAAEAGAKAISYEVGFVPGGMTVDLKRRWKILEQIAGVPFIQLYKSFGGLQSCIRPPYEWTENIMHAIYEEAKKCGMTVGVSDPVWKQLTESGCCCGILPDDPVFGNWEPENATNMLLKSKKTGCTIEARDIIPPWAYTAKLDGMVNPGVGPKVNWDRRHETWADRLWGTWNITSGQRSPLNYFQGALMPVKKEPSTFRKGGLEIIYKYVGLQRKRPECIPYWRI